VHEGLIAAKPVGCIEFAPDMVFFEHLYPQGAFLGLGEIHHGAAQPPTVEGRVQEQPRQFIVHKGDKADDCAVDLDHGCFGVNQIDVA